MSDVGARKSFVGPGRCRCVDIPLARRAGARVCATHRQPFACAMSIKATKTHTDKDGKPVRSHRLMLSQRVGDRVRHRTLLNLGTHDPIPRERWTEVTDLAAALLHTRPPLLQAAPDVQAAAEDIVAKLRARGFRTEATQEEARKPDIATVALDTLEHETPRTVGCERLCLKALDDLGFADILHDLGIKGREGRIASALVVAGMVHPASERETSRWLRRDSATAELLDLEGDRKALRRKTLYRIGDLLWRHRAAIQRELFNRERALLDIPDTIAFYDLTNVHDHGHTHGERPRFGRSRQKRDDCPLITLALALDGAGFPRSCEILPGTVSEPGTLEDALVRLEAVCGGTAPKPTVVMDAGIATEENIAWLGEPGYDWIAVSRGGKPPPPEGGPEALLITSAHHEVRAWRLASEDGAARLSVVSEGKKTAETSILGLRRTRFEAALERLHSGLPVKGRLKRYDKVLESVGRLKQRVSAVARPYEITVETADTGPNASAVRFKRRPLYDEADEGAGADGLRTSHIDWDIETILRTYWRITDIEATFRSLTSELGLRPIWHQRDRRIAAHLRIAVLAYHAVHLIRTRLAARGIHKGWASVRDGPADLGADHHAPAPDRRHGDRQPPGHAPGRRGCRNLLGGGRGPRHPPQEGPPDELTESNKMWGHVEIGREQYHPYQSDKGQRNKKVPTWVKGAEHEAAPGCGRAWDAGAGVGDRGDGSRLQSSGRAD